MLVTTRSGAREKVRFDKITDRIEKLTFGLDENFVDVSEITQKTVRGLYDGITTEELDNLSAEVAAYMATVHPDYSILAGRIAVSNLHRSTSESFLEVTKSLYHFINKATGKETPLINKEYYDFVCENIDRIQSEIDYQKDFLFDYFRFEIKAEFFCFFLFKINL